MNINSLSSTAKRIHNSGVGYRYEGISTGVYPIQESLRFEIKELGNVDVFGTINNLYNIKTKNLKTVLSIVHEFFNQELSNGLTIYGIWVSTKAGIERNYINDYEYECGPVTLLKYKLPKKRLILSDLGEEGVWFAIAIHPDNLVYEEVLSTKFQGRW